MLYFINADIGIQYIYFFHTLYIQMKKTFVNILPGIIFTVAGTIVMLLNGRPTCGQEGSNPLNANEKVKVTMGKTEVIRSVDMLPRVFGNDDTAWYALPRKSRTGIARYDSSLDKSGEGFFSANEDMKTREIVDIIYFHDSIYLFFATEGVNKPTLHVKNISKSTLEEEESSHVVFSFPFVRGRGPLSGIQLSRDRSRLLRFSRIILYSQKQGLLEMKVCGAGLITQWSNSFQFSFIRAPRHMNRFRVDEWGNAYMLDYLYNPPVLNITGRPNKLMLLAVTENGNRSETTELSIPNRYIKSAEIEPAGHDAVISAGFFSDTQLEGTVSGSYYFRVNTIHNIIRNYREYLISLTDFSSGDSFGLFVNHLIYKQEGYAFMVAEQYFREEHRRYQNLYIS